jgi:CdiI immunity protein
VSDYPAISFFFEAYLHQDWRLDYPSVTGAVASYAEDSDRQTMDDAIRDLTAILETQTNEEELAEISHKLGLSDDPVAQGHSYRSWLSSLLATMAEARAQRWQVN